jgi:hypothetical protein
MKSPSNTKLITVRLDFFTTEQGGRKSPAFGGELRTVIRHQGADHSCALYYDATRTLKPGDTTEAEIAVLMQEILGKFKVGDPFALWEGGIFAVGVVLSI